MAVSTPAEILRRILRISGVNGWSVTIAAGLGTLFSLVFTDLIAIITGAVVAFGGITELQGRMALLRGEARGMRQLCLAQLIVLMMLWVYAITQLLTFDAAALLAKLPTDILTMAHDAGWDESALASVFRLANLLTYGVLMLVTLIYQGGLAIYYRHRSPLVAAMLSEPPSIRH